MRVLLTSTPGQGHAHPLIPFARAARAAGAEVRLAIAPEGIPGVGHLGVPLVPTASPAPDVAGPYWAALPADPDEANDHVVAGWFAGLVARAALPAINAEVEEWQPDLVISESGELAGPSCAEAAGIRHLTVGVTALAGGLYGTPRLVDEVNTTRRLLGLRETSEVPWLRGTTTYVTAVPRILWASPDEVPPGTRVVRHEDPEGPVRVAPPRQRGRRPRVYATLGTAAARQEMARPAYAAVLAALADLDADVLFTIGGHDRDSLGPVPPHVTVERYVPQARAMDCDLVLSHGGSGTTVAALTRGIPQVVAPLFADQPWNAQRLAAAGIGLAVDVRQGPDGLAGALRQVLGDPSYAVAARAVAADLAALPTPGELLADLGVLADPEPAAVH